MKQAEHIQDYGALPHILVVDDDDRIRDLVSRYLSDHGFFVSTVASADEAQEILTFAAFDALVVDVMMPGQNGMEFTQELRSNQDHADLPVLLLTAMGEMDDKIKGLSAGADDYLTKPFDPRELVLRLEAILRRRPKPQDQSQDLQIGGWVFHHDQKILVDGDITVKLTDGEVALIDALAVTLGQVVSREVLSESCGFDPDKRTVDVQVTRLRRKLEEDSNMPRYLQTMRGKGYILRAERL